MDHEIGDHPVKAEPVIKLLIAKCLEIGDRLRGLVVKQFDTNQTLIGVKCCDLHR